MIIYNPKDWWKLIFAFHKSDTFRMMLPGIIGVAVFTGIVAYIENEVFHATFKNTTAVHSLVGFALSLLLVFRTNTAYDRWWEGRRAWGSLVNNSRNLALKLSVLELTKEEKTMFSALISNYILAAKEHLRGIHAGDQLIYTGEYNESYFLAYNHLPNRVMQAIYKEIQQLLVTSRLSEHQLLYINEELRSFTDNIGICERIKRTPIPYSYSLYLKKIIFFYVFTMPIGFVREFGYWAMPIVALVFYVFAGIEMLAEEIEDPFGTDANDLPTDQLYETIRANVAEIFQLQA
ncbi:MAG: bestrophin family ion channel [Saprospiraceae bacterium]